MLNSPVLNVVIGLVFVYLLYSLLATIIKEMIASMLSLRANMLSYSIKRMLDDGGSNTTIWRDFGKFWKNLFYSILLRLFNYKPKPHNTLSVIFFDNPGIKYLADGKKNSKPSYLEPSVFSKTLVDVLKEKGTEGKNIMGQISYAINNCKILKIEINKDIKTSISSLLEDSKEDINKYKDVIRNALKTKLDKETEKYFKSLVNNPTVPIDNFKALLDNGKDIDFETKKFILSLVGDSNNDIDKFKALLEQWFDNMMDRTTGWYKRQAQSILFIIGLVIALSFNINTFGIVSKLSKDKNAADRLATMATAYVNNPDKAKMLDTLAKKKGDSAVLAYDQLKSFYTSNQKDINDANQVLALGWGLDKLSMPFRYCVDSIKCPNDYCKINRISKECSSQLKMIRWLNFVDKKMVDSLNTLINNDTVSITKIVNGINTLISRGKSIGIMDSINKKNRYQSKADSLIKLQQSLITSITSRTLLLEKETANEISDSLGKSYFSAKITHGKYSCYLIEGEKKYCFCQKIGYVFTNGLGNSKSLLGLLLTAIAISMGAPFWFDLLNKIVSLRNAGGKPEDPPSPSNGNSSNNSTVNPINRVG